jgi:hypothetical protein
MNPRLQLVVKAELEKLLEAGFIKPVEITDLGFSYGIGEEEKWETTSVHRLSGFEQKHSKGPFSLSIRQYHTG